jgi:nucleoside-diphosphate-sugar epimerase
MSGDSHASSCDRQGGHLGSQPCARLLKQECVIGAINMLGLTKRLHARILQGSTSEEYGEQPEGYGRLGNMAGLRTCYDEGKRCAKTLFYDFGRQHGPPVGVARILNTYGLNLHPQEGSVVSRFIAQGLKIEPIILNGSASQTRSFVDDTIHGLTRLYKCRINAECDTNGAVKVGNPAKISFCERADFVTLSSSCTGHPRCTSKERSLQDDRLLPSPSEANKLMWGQI